MGEAGCLLECLHILEEEMTPRKFIPADNSKKDIQPFDGRI